MGKRIGGLGSERDRRFWTAMQVPGFLALGGRRIRQIQRAMQNAKVTLRCLFVTVLVLRGTIGAGKFGTPEQDFNEIREHLIVGRRGEPHRVLTEVVAESSNNKTPPVVEEEVEEPDVERDPSVPYSFGPKISDWDDQRFLASAFMTAALLLDCKACVCFVLGFHSSLPPIAILG